MEELRVNLQHTFTIVGQVGYSQQTENYLPKP